VVGIPRQRLEERAEALADQGEWTSFIDILALLGFGTILFPNVDGLVDLATIDAFLAYHHNKESPVITDAILPRKGQVTRAMSKRLQEDWARAAEKGPRVLMNLRVDF